MDVQYLFGMLIIVIISYLLGSIPTAYIVAKINGRNIFEVGSGNMGATNVTRALGLKWGLLVLAVDVLKAILAIIIARWIKPGSYESATAVAAIVVIVGHNWSLFASLVTGTLRGGKGAATAFGTLLMIAPIQVWIGMMIVGGVVILRTRYVSLAVLLMIGLAVLWLTVLTLQQQLDETAILYSWSLAGLIVLRFRENIHRLLTGTERRLGERV
ncbi:MAG: glycerol-3-phosphate acyltransferase [Chloroflexi bacterium]|nr:MAG: glycerol-3-phosphate acyltransferase [Chloroflexota bacterium]